MATFMLAFDHRDSLMTSFFETGEAGKAEVASARSLKTLIADGLLAAVNRYRIDRKEAGALVDATYGGIAIDKLRTRGVRFAVPVEASGKREHECEHPDWRQRLDAIRPTWAKVLVRYNPSGDTDMNGRQRERLLELQAGTRELRVGFLFELLVPPEVDQRGADFDTEIRPGLVVQAIEELRGAGIEADLWKIEGFERRADCEAVASVAGAPCVVLGRGADAAAVERWLRAGAGVFDGFAIGRSIWWDPCRSFVDETIDRDAAVAAIAERYGHFVDVYRSAE
jgi:myo-inositol catabolism protein IolC